MNDLKLNEFAESIPTYWKEYLDNKIKTIHHKQIASGITSSSFGLVTDMHLGVVHPDCNTNRFHSPALLKKVMDDCDIPYFFNAGDVFAGHGLCTKDINIADFIACKKLFKNIESKCLIAEGNHDAIFSEFEVPDYYAQNMSLAEFYEYYFKFEAQYSDRHFGFDGTYYYVDMIFQKTRLIVLNTHDIPDDCIDAQGRPMYNKFRANGTGIMQEQLDWFAHVALCVPSPEWTVVLCTHESPASVGRDGICNFGIIHDIINAFRHHSNFQGKSEYDNGREHYNSEICVDYTDCGGNFALWVSGHSHFDTSVVIEGILSVATLNDSMHNSDNSKFKHIEGTTSEQAFDIFTLDKLNHKIYVTRIGCGEDREFTYEVF